jgi:two-component system nitrogen regulation response regulator GlnG/two-component system response regulator AtoC
MRPFDGVELLKRIRMAQPNAMVILNGRVHSTNAVIEAMRLGAFDVLRREAVNFELRGIADLVLETRDGFYVVDHKSFPGDAATGLEKARGFAGQLNAYARALEAAWGKPCLGMFIHLAVLGRVVELRS